MWIFSKLSSCLRRGLKITSENTLMHSTNHSGLAKMANANIISKSNSLWFGDPTNHNGLHAAPMIQLYIQERPLVTVYTPDEKLELQDYDDTDTCPANEIDNVFSTKCRLIAEEEVTSNESYIMHITGTRDINFNVAIGTSNNSCDIYQFSNDQFVKLDSLEEHSDSIAGIQFSPENNNLLYSASIDGVIRLWDLRLSKKCVSQFTETTAENPQSKKSIICFDVSSNNRLLAAGTELHEGEAFVLFWDVRNTNLLGGYWESHTDDVTQLKFDPDNINTLVSGSTDGLINIYDLKHASEDDALVDSLNTESSVEQLMWYTHKGRGCICCITHTVDVQLWKTDGAEPYAHFRRAEIANQIKRKSEAHCYLVAAHKCMNDEVMVLAGSNGNNGECVRALHTNGSNLEPLFSLKENKQRIRSSWYNQYHNILVTGGENGILNAWHIDLKTNL